MEKTPQHILESIRRAGVISDVFGQNNPGLPAHDLFQMPAEILIASGIESEPLFANDSSLISQRAQDLVRGMHWVLKTTGARKGVVALQENQTSALRALKEVLPEDGSIRLHVAADYYPAGDPFLLTYEVTGRVVPEGGEPSRVGIAIGSVATFLQIADALNGKPVTRRTVTVAGEVRRPKVITAPLGTSYTDLLEQAGGLKQNDAVVLEGGPMMGKIIQDLEQGVAKTTEGILALPAGQFVVRMKTKTLDEVVRQSQSACCQCMRCTDLCPRALLGHDLFPHKTMRAIGYNLSEPAGNITSAFLCTGCGLCELVACDFMQLSPRKILEACREKLVSSGIENPHRRMTCVSSQYDNAKISLATLLKKLGLEKYSQTLPLEEARGVKRVRIPIQSHAGAKAIPLVRPGAYVRQCDAIAASPKGESGAVYHASLAGKVSAVTERMIEITSKE